MFIFKVTGPSPLQSQEHSRLLSIPEESQARTGICENRDQIGLIKKRRSGTQTAGQLRIVQPFITCMKQAQIVSRVLLCKDMATVTVTRALVDGWGGWVGLGMDLRNGWMV